MKTTIILFLIFSIETTLSAEIKEITIEKSKSGNPFLGFDKNGDLMYGGDPSILVDGDTVYAYVGHDT